MEISTTSAKFCQTQVLLRSSSIRFLLLGLAIFLGSCITPEQYREVTVQKEILERRIAALDSTQQLGNQDITESQETKRDYVLAMRQIEQLRATNLNLNQSYQELLTRYSDLVNRNRDLLATSSEAQQNLRGQADQRFLELQEKTRQLQELENQLSMREQRLRDMESSYGKTLEVRSQEIIDLQQQLIARDERIMRIQNTLQTTLAAFIDRNELTIKPENEGIKLSIPDATLLNANGTQLTQRGKELLKAITGAIYTELPLKIQVLGHTDDSANAQNNWETSLHHAFLTSMELFSQGIPPEHSTVGGKGSFQPAAPNDSRPGRAQNKRVEIILSPLTGLQLYSQPPNPR